MFFSAASSSVSVPLVVVGMALMATTVTLLPSTLALLQTPLFSRIKTTTTPAGDVVRITFALTAPQREDAEVQLLSSTQRNTVVPTKNSDDGVYLSDIPRDDNPEPSNFDVDAFMKAQKERFLKPPPPPEDQFIMMGDIAVLFLYAYTSHALNDMLVQGELSRTDISIREVVNELDPTHALLNAQQIPVWVDLSTSYTPNNDPAIDHLLQVSARESLMNHWGPLLSTEGSACVALCTCWLIAGYMHRAFLFRNSLYCDSTKTLTKTFETWLTSAVLLTIFAALTDSLVGHLPFLQNLLCVTCRGGQENDLPFLLSSLTRSDAMFIIDSLTVLVAWRWTVHRILNIF